MGGKGSGGRNKKPTALRKLQGNPGKRRLNKNEPVPPAGGPDMPRGLSQGAQQFWQDLVPILEEMNVLSRADGLALGKLCMALDRRMKAEQAIQQFGILIAEVQKDGTKKIKKNPAVNIASDADRHINTGLDAFGLTPASRSRLSTNKGDDSTQDPLENFLGGKTSSEIVQ